MKRSASLDTSVSTVTLKTLSFGVSQTLESREVMEPTLGSSASARTMRVLGIAAAIWSFCLGAVILKLSSPVKFTMHTHMTVSLLPMVES